MEMALKAVDDGDAGNNEKGDQLESTRVKMWQVKEENERLKAALSRIVKDYQSLEMQFHDAAAQDPAALAEDPEQLVALSLGTATTSGSTEKTNRQETGRGGGENDHRTTDDEELSLGLRHVRNESMSPENNSTGEETAAETVTLKNSRREDDDEAVDQMQRHVKKTRVSVRARCDTPTMNDGCQWRKYGQKVSKGNPCPRAYYRCTVAAGCPVRKQVQRCINDMSILITTYEGTHSHPLPLAATAMASTTSAAASMLSSGPSPSRPGTFAPFISATAHPNQFYISNQPSPSSSSHPTITLDLTSTSASSSATTAFNFSSSNIATGASGSLYYKDQYVCPYQSHWPRAASSAPMINYAPAVPQRNVLSTDTIARAITLDPGFQSVLAAAITTYVGGARGGDQGGVPASGPKNASASPGDDQREKNDR